MFEKIGKAPLGGSGRSRGSMNPVLIMVIVGIIGVGGLALLENQFSQGRSGGVSCGGCGGVGDVGGGLGATPTPGAVINPSNPGVTSQPVAAQDVYIRALGGSNYGKYDTNEVTVKKGVPVRLHFSADSDAGCGRLLVIYGLGVRLVTKPGEEAVTEFTPDKTGEFQYSCGMRMFGPGVFKVVD